MNFVKKLIFILSLSAVQLWVKIDAQTEGCGGTFYGLSGTISSPNYPSNYGNNLNCYYYIQIAPPNYVNITFISFQTELSADWLQVNCSSDDIIPARRFSGSSLPSPLSIPPCANVLLQFHTDGSEVYQGFRLTYTIYNGCGGTYAGQSGIISSPNYPSNYNNYLNCSYYIQSSPPNYVNITFMSFATELYYDWLQISCTSDSTKPVQRFGGLNLPPFLSISSCYTVQLLFHTDVSVVVQGFRLRYDIGNGLQGGLTLKPMNLYIPINSTEPIVLSCSSRANQPDAYPWWTYISNDYPYYVEILTTSNCSVSSSLKFSNSAYFNTTRQYSSRTCNLTILRFYPSLGTGIYTCTDSTLDFFNVLMTYVDPSFKFVNLNSTTEVVRNDQISVTCSVQVSQITLPVPQLVPSIYLYSSDNQYPIKVSNSTVSLNLSASPEILPSYFCNINFTYSRNFSAGYATNLPQGISFTTQARQVLYWPENKTMVIKGDNNGQVAANGNLTCFVPANPPVTYQWADETTNRLWRGPTVTVEHNSTYTCTANSIIRGIPYEASKSITVTVIDGDQSLPYTGNNLNTLALIIGIVVGVSVLLIVVAIVVFICLRRKKIPSTPDPAATTNVDPQNDNLYERSRRDTLYAEEGDNNAYEMIDYKTRE